MSIIYYGTLIASILFLLYTSINVLLIVKFINHLSPIMKNKYSLLAKTSKKVILFSFICFTANFFIPVTLFKCFLLIIGIFLNCYIISETSILKSYI